MLSAHKLGPKGVEYYVSYAGRGAEGYWLGKAAASLGLVGAVDPAAFRALAKGEHPDGGRLLERVASDHTPGWDFTPPRYSIRSTRLILSKPKLSQDNGS